MGQARGDCHQLIVERQAADLGHEYVTDDRIGRAALSYMTEGVTAGGGFLNREVALLEEASQGSAD